MVIDVGRCFCAQCNACGHVFKVRSGPSMSAYLLHCDRCGGERWVNSMDLDLDWRDTNDVERCAGHCACGGNFTIGAPLRCSRCRSADLLLDIAVNGAHYEEFYD
ncbi:MAG: hypothetical protein ACXV5F_07225 [Halobacteriota archaeon]